MRTVNIMRWVFLILFVNNIYAGAEISIEKRAINKAKQAINLFQKAIQENNTTAIHKAYQLAENALHENKTDPYIQYICYTIGYYEIEFGITKDKKVVKSLKTLFPNLYQMKVNPAPPAYLDTKLLGDKNITAKFKLLKKAIKENPQYANSYLELANAYSQKKKYDLAINMLQRGLNHSDNTNRFLFHRALAYAYLDKSYQLEKKLLCADIDKALVAKIIKEAKAALKIFPQSTDMYRLLANSYERMGKNELSLDAIRRLYKYDKTDYGLKTFEEYLITSGAKKEFFQLQKEGKGSGNRENLVSAYFMNQDWEKVAKIYHQLVESKDESVYFYLYLKYLASSGIVHGKNVFEKRLQSMPTDMIKNDWQKLLLQLISNKVQLAVLLTKADTPCKRTEAYFWAGMNSLMAKDKKKAKQYFQKVLDEKVYGYVEYIASKYYLKEGIK